MPFSVDALPSSLGCIPRQICHSSWGCEPSGGAGLSCGDPNICGSHSCRVRRSTEATALLKKGVKILLFAHHM